jgi:hypothetical protein
VPVWDRPSTGYQPNHLSSIGHFLLDRERPKLGAKRTDRIRHRALTSGVRRQNSTDGLCPAEVGVGGCDIVKALVIALMWKAG